LISNGEILGGLVEHLLLTGVPGIAAALFAIRCGTRSLPVLIGIALAVSGTFATLSFWAYYADPSIGRVWGFLGLFGSLEVAGWSWWTGDLDRRVLRKLRTPLLLWLLGSVFIAFLGFLHGGTDQAVSMSATRFTGQLPTDNDIPRFFAEWFAAHGHHGRPPIYPGEWLMSDRPPLQVGYVLSQRAFGNSAGDLHYQLLGIVIQQLWIPAMWAVLWAARLRPSTRSLAMFAAMVSDVAIVHGFFVWPKLLAASFLLAATALVFAPEWARWRRDPRIGFLLGCLLALALLAHGSSVFGVVPLAAIAVFRGLPSWRWIGVAALAGAVLLGSWAAYQHYADPPGNRLLKWQLGGDVGSDDRGTLKAITDGYSEAGWTGTLENKADNFGEMVGTSRFGEVGDEVDAFAAAEPETAIEKLRSLRFFSLLPLLGVFILAPFAMILGRTRARTEEADWDFALRCLAFVGIACLVWGLLLFGTVEARTTVHVGSLTVPLLGLCGCVAGLMAVRRRLAIAVVAINVVIVLVLYSPSLTAPPGTSYSAVAAILTALALAGIGLVLYREEEAEAGPEEGLRAVLRTSRPSPMEQRLARGGSLHG
jgi:hypothetical protein